MLMPVLDGAQSVWPPAAMAPVVTKADAGGTTLHRRTAADHMYSIAQPWWVRRGGPATKPGVGYCAAKAPATPRHITGSPPAAPYSCTATPAWPVAEDTRIWHCSRPQYGDLRPSPGSGRQKGESLQHSALGSHFTYSYCQLRPD